MKGHSLYWSALERERDVEWAES